jgi:Tol biopolymer transport system component
VYFSPAGAGEIQGTIFKIPALGGAAQRVIASIGGGDVNRDGRVACFRLENQRIQLVTSTLQGSDIKVVAELETWHFGYPRWSPDHRWIAYQAGDGFRSDVFVVAASGGQKPVQRTHDRKTIRGLAWLPDSTGILYASARGSTLPYLAPLALWEVSVNGHQPPRQLTSFEAWFEQPDLHDSGIVSVTRMNMRFDIWKYAFGGPVVTAVERGQRVTRQTGHVSTPAVSPLGDEMAYLSDDDGHSNVWVMSANGQSRRITNEHDPEVAVGVPIWSPNAKWIAFVSSKGNVGFAFGVWIVRPDGSELQQVVPQGFGVAWSEDGKSLYYVETASSPIKKIAVPGGQPQTARPETARNLIAVHESTIYYLIERALMDGRPQFEIHAAPLGGGPARSITTIPASRIASWQVPNPSLSPDGKWLAMPLTDGFTTNIWAISTADGHFKQVTDFGDQPVFIVRRVSWSPDSRHILAAIGEGDTDIYLLDGLIKGVAR